MKKRNYVRCVISDASDASEPLLPHRRRPRPRAHRLRPPPPPRRSSIRRLLSAGPPLRRHQTRASASSVPSTSAASSPPVLHCAAAVPEHPRLPPRRSSTAPDPGAPPGEDNRDLGNPRGRGRSPPSSPPPFPSTPGYLL